MNLMISPEEFQTSSSTNSLSIFELALLQYYSQIPEKKGLINVITFASKNKGTILHDFLSLRIIKIILSRMSEQQIRLNQLISSNDISCKRRGSMYVLNNSFKRNTLCAFSPLNSKDIQYDCKLPQVTYKQKDLSKMLGLILAKEEMTLGDRNFLRRVMVQTFDQELIHSGSRNFILHLELMKHKQDDIMFRPIEKMFCFVLRGSARVKSGGFQYNVKEGDTFGHIQMLSNSQLEQIQFTEKTIVLKLSQINFQNYFRHYFQKKYSQKLQKMQSILQKYLKNQPQINKYLLCDEIIQIILNPGDKIVQKGKPNDRIYFVGQHWKGDNSHQVLDGCLGLRQLLKNKDKYMESVYNLEQFYKVSYVPVEKFKKFIEHVQIVNSPSIGESVVKVIVDDPQKSAHLQKSMKTKRVRISSKSKKLITDPIETIVSDFKFFKSTELDCTPTPKLKKSIFRVLTKKKDLNKGLQISSKRISLNFL